MPSSGDTRVVKSADRVLRVLEALSVQRSPMTLSELSVRLEIPKSSLHAILRTMERRDWVRIGTAPGNEISLGVGALAVGAGYDEGERVLARVEPVLDWLYNELGETIHFGHLKGFQVVYVAMRTSAHPLRLHTSIGSRFPAYATAMGKAIMAVQEVGSAEECLPSSLDSLTPFTVTNKRDLLAELERVRDTGLAVDHEESTLGVRCFGVAVAVSNPVAHGISVELPSIRLDEALEKRIRRCLLEAKSRVEQPLGSAERSGLS